MSPPDISVYMSAGGVMGSVATGVRIDLRYLHDVWMGTVFPRQRLGAHNVLGRWRPQTTAGKITYWIWYVLGGPLILLLYPFVLAGFAIRFYARGLGGTASRIGLIGVILTVAIIWGLLAAVAFLQLPMEGFIAVAAAGVVATVSAGLAFGFARTGGRATTVIFAYPFAMNAIFLPPVVAALYSPWLAQIIFPGSEELAIWILNNVLHVGGINEWLRAQYTLEGIAYAGMWFGIAVPIGWVLGLLVTLADQVRPKQEGTGEPSAGRSPGD